MKHPKRSISSLLLVLFCVAALAQQSEPAKQQTPEAEKPKRGADAHTVKQFLALMDQDRDGQISRKEFKGPSLAFRRIDRDRDGSLNAEELKEMRRGPNYQGPLARFLSIDKDGDGRLSRVELTGPAARIDFFSADLDKDGTLTMEEIHEYHIRERSLQIEEFISRNDTNRDGRVTRQEFGGEARQFDLMDADMDAVITRADVETRENKVLAPPARRGKQ
ncbi:MAG: EF-hand domain-containing protein [Acidobacteriota bacterium]